MLDTSRVDSTFGCLFLAGIFASVLWGIGCLQLWLYFEKYSRNDPHWFKPYLLSIWTLDAVHQAFVVQMNYNFFVRSITDPTLLGRFPRHLTSIAMLSAFIDAMVQSVFARRAWYLSNKNIALTGTLGIVILAQFVMNTVYFAEMYGFVDLAQLRNIIHVEIALNCVSCFMDSFIAGTLIYLLWRGRSGVKRTDSLIKRLIAYTISTGLIASLWISMAIVGILVAPHSLIYLLADLVIPKLYFNCMLASLNVRSSLRDALEREVIDISIPTSEIPTYQRSASTTFSSVICEIARPSTRLDIEDTHEAECDSNRTSESRYDFPKEEI